MKILLYIVYAICFFVFMTTLEVVWTNVKAYAKEKNYQQCLLYLLGGTVVVFVLVAITDVANSYLQ